jgi:hypothetical protein
MRVIALRWMRSVRTLPCHMMRMEALVEQLVNLKSIEAPAAKKFAATACYENRYVNELEREGFFKKLWQ